MANSPSASRGPLPRHIAIIMDGNGRWASKRNLPRTAGHSAGVASTRRTVEHCAQLGIEALTLFAFSSENWRRPDSEISALLELFLLTLRREAKRLERNGVRLHLVGDRARFPQALQDRIEEVEAITRTGSGLQLIIAANYGGRWDILEAARQCAAAVARGEASWDDLNETDFQRQTALASFPEPDLFIRTGGERRISNFLLWQLAYTELYFSDVLWPDFNEFTLDEALADYARRQRRFGRTSEQTGAS